MPAALLAVPLAITSCQVLPCFALPPPAVVVLQFLGWQVYATAPGLQLSADPGLPSLSVHAGPLP